MTECLEELGEQSQEKQAKLDSDVYDWKETEPQNSICSPNQLGNSCHTFTAYCAAGIRLPHPLISFEEGHKSGITKVTQDVAKPGRERAERKPVLYLAFALSFEALVK